MRSKFFKRAGAMLLGMALFVSAFSVTALTQTVTGWAKDLVDENGLQYREDSDTLSVAGYQGSGADVVIPDTYMGKKVIRIGERAFAGKDIQSVVIGNYVESIYGSAFRDCKQLEKVEFGTSLRFLYGSAFDGCEKLESITLPDSLKEIYGSAFSGTGCYNNEENWKENGLYVDGWLVEIREGTTGSFPIAEGTKQIVSNLFRQGNGREITEVGIPASLEENQPHFSGERSAICSFTVDVDNPYYSCEDGILYNKDQTKILEVVKKLPRTYRIPSGVKEIGSLAFSENCTAKAIIIPKTVERIDYAAFARVARTVGLLCEVKTAPAGWDKEWAVTEDVWLDSELPAGNIHYGYRGKAVTAINGLYQKWLKPENKYGKTITFKKGDQRLLEFTPKSGANGYVRWVSSKPSVLQVKQDTNYMQGFWVEAKKTGTVWLKAYNSKGKVIAQYKVRVKAK